MKDKDKIRFELIPPFANEQFAKVLTHGAKQHGDWSWKNGRDFSDIIGSIKRCLSEIEKGNDIDNEGLYNAAKIMTHAAILCESYKLNPDFDDRPHDYLNTKRVGLDVDEVLADFNKAWMKRFNLVDEPNWWFFDNKMQERFKELIDKNELEDFYLKIEPKIKPEDIPFEPYCYVTSRPVSSEITAKWLQMHNFPAVPVYTVPPNTTKVDILKELGVQIMIDDRIDNFVEINKAGISCFLYDCNHNKRYNVGYKRINSLKDLKI